MLVKGALEVGHNRFYMLSAHADERQRCSELIGGRENLVVLSRAIRG